MCEYDKVTKDMNICNIFTTIDMDALVVPQAITFISFSATSLQSSGPGSYTLLLALYPDSFLEGRECGERPGYTRLLFCIHAA